MCFYDIGIWSKYTAGALAKFKSCYYKCVKAFFGYKHCDLHALLSFSA